MSKGEKKKVIKYKSWGGAIGWGEQWNYKKVVVFIVFGKTGGRSSFNSLRFCWICRKMVFRLIKIDWKVVLVCELHKAGVKILMDKHSIMLLHTWNFQLNFSPQKNQTRWKKLKISANYMGNKLNENKLDDVFLVHTFQRPLFGLLFHLQSSLHPSPPAQAILSTCES